MLRLRNAKSRYINEVSVVKRPGYRWLKRLFASDIATALLKQAACFLMGLLSSSATIFGGYSPFGVAVSSAVPYRYLLSTSVGAMIGCLAPFPVRDNVRYIAAILAVAALRWALNGFLTVAEHPLFSPIVAALPIFVTGIAMSVLMGGYDSAAIVITITETLMSAGAAFFFLATAKIVSGNRGITALTYQELACVALCLCTVLLALSSLNIGAVSIGRVLAVIAVLFCAKYAGVVGGAISGVATGAMLSFSGTDITYIAGAYALGGLMAGMFSKLSKLAAAVGFVLAGGIIVLQTGSTPIAVTSLYEVAIASVVFMLIPASAGQKISKIFDPSMGGPNVSGLKDSVVMRMDFAARTIMDINSCVDKVSEKFKLMNIPNIRGVYKATADRICKNCNLKLLCWERDGKKTMKVFTGFDTILKEGNELTTEDFPEFFKNRCSKTQPLSDTVNELYHSYVGNNLAQGRINSVRSALGNQFHCMADVLGDLKEEISLYDRFDYIMAQRLKGLFLSFGIAVNSVSCRINKYDILTIEIETVRREKLKLLGKELFTFIEKISDRKLDVPSIMHTDKSTKIQITQKAVFEVTVAQHQHVCGGAKLCGDNYVIFNDGFGNAYAILSDGMGTGGAAAVDSAMTVSIFEKLLKAGFSMTSALKLVNSSLIVKSAQESLATVDIVKINLFTGETQIRKAGATFTFIKRKGKVKKIELPSLPIGILTEMSFAGKDLTLGRNDTLLMVSDGVIASGEEWVRKELMKHEDEPGNELAERIVEQARFRRNDGHDDDITALVLRLI